MITAACGARDASKKRLAAWFITATESMLLTVAVGGKLPLFTELPRKVILGN